MKNEQFTGYAVAEPGGILRLPVKVTRREAVDEFLTGSTMSWKEAYRIGWRVYRVTVRKEVSRRPHPELREQAKKEESHRIDWREQSQRLRKWGLLP